MGYTKQFFEKTKEGTAAQKGKAWTMLVIYAIAVYGGLIALFSFGAGGGILIGILLVLETWESPSAMVLFVDAVILILSVGLVANERFRQSAREYAVTIWQKI